MMDINTKISIRSYRKQGLSYSAISREAGVHRNRVTRYCNSAGIDVDVHPNVMAANVRTGATLTKPKIIYTCKQCGKAYTLKPSRCGDEGKSFCSRDCFFEYHTENKKPQSTTIHYHECVICGGVFITKRIKSNHCSDVCRKEDNRRRSATPYALMKRREAQRLRNGLHERTGNCIVCGKHYTTYRSDQTTCGSVKCGKTHKHRTRRARSYTAFVEHVGIKELFIRDGGKCQLCGKRVRLSDKVPHKNAPTIDHIQPLSRGGLHEYRNTQLACFRCNSVKGNRVIPGGEQLRLFG